MEYPFPSPKPNSKFHFMNEQLQKIASDCKSQKDQCSTNEKWFYVTQQSQWKFSL
jgi:hypothetical protein